MFLDIHKCHKLQQLTEKKYVCISKGVTLSSVFSNHLKKYTDYYEW